MNGRHIAFVFVGILAAAGSQPARPAAWLEETFDAYKVAPLDGQGGWSGTTQRILVVSTTSLQGNAVMLDGADNPMPPVLWQEQRPAAVPSFGRHVFSFAVRVDTLPMPFMDQGSFALASEGTRAIELKITPTSAVMTIRNDFVFMICVAAWDLGTVAGGAPDLTTGTFHRFEVDLDFGAPGEPLDDYVRDVRLDGQSQAHLFISNLPGPIFLQKPLDRLVLENGSAAWGATKPVAVFFDSIIGRPTSLVVRHWQLY